MMPNVRVSIDYTFRALLATLSGLVLNLFCDFVQDIR